MGRTRGWVSLFVVLSATVGFACSKKSSPGSAGSSAALTGNPIMGQTAVTARACASCHKGKDGSLSGVDVPYMGTQAFPPNLTPDKDTGLGDWDETTIANAILTGMDDENEQLCPTMPVFENMGMTDQEAHDIAAYLKTLAPVPHMAPESVCPPLKTSAESGAAGATH